jgi:hypothetical protein
MRIFDLVFIVIFLSSASTLIRSLCLAVRGRTGQAGHVFLRLVFFWAVYMAIVIGVSLGTPRRWIAKGSETCFDEWCITALKGERTGAAYAVAVRVTSHSLGRPQRASDGDLELWDRQNYVYHARPACAQRMQSMLRPGESFELTCEFDVPVTVSIKAARAMHGVSGPGIVIIGDSNSLLHQRTLLCLEDSVKTCQAFD